MSSNAVNWLTVKEMAAWLKKNRRSINRDVQKGALPKPFRIGGVPSWDMEEVVIFLKEKRGAA
jgi:predicted DNA-binding transcriptional regulator AlpA